MSYLERDSKSDLEAALTRCGKKSLAFSISSILSGEKNNINNNINNNSSHNSFQTKEEAVSRTNYPDQEQDPSDDEVNKDRS